MVVYRTVGGMNYLQEVQELWREHLGDGGQLPLADLVPLVSIGGQWLRP